MANLLKFTLNLSDYLLYLSLYFLYVYSKNPTIDIGIANHNDINNSFIINAKIAINTINTTHRPINNKHMTKKYCLKFSIELFSSFEINRQISNIKLNMNGITNHNDLHIKYTPNPVKNIIITDQNIDIQSDTNVLLTILK